jgi:transcriptional regulator with XRE-family HTH domain
MTQFAENLLEARQNRGWNQANLAKAVGLSQGAISQFEKGLRIPTPAYIEKFSRVFNVSRDYLWGEDEVSSCRIRIIRDLQCMSLMGLKKVEDYVGLVKKVVG